MTDWKLLLLLVLCCNANLIDFKLRLFTDTNLELPDQNIASDQFEWVKIDKHKLFLRETKLRLERLFLSFERDLSDSQRKLSKIFHDTSANASALSELDCCQDVEYGGGNRSVDEMVNKAVACQRTFTVEYGQCQSTIHLSNDVINNWKHNDMMQENLMEQWYASMQDQCVKTFVYPAKKDKSLCIETTGLHNSKKEAITNAILPKNRHWAFLFDLNTFSSGSDEKSAAILLRMAANLAFSIVQFSGPRDFFSISGLPMPAEPERSDVFNCNNSEKAREMFSSYSFPSSLKSSLVKNQSQVNHVSLSEQLEKVLETFELADSDSEKVLVVFSGLRPVDSDSQHRRIEAVGHLFEDVNLAVFRMGNIILSSELLNNDYWSTEFDSINVLSKNVEVVTPSRRPKTLTFPQLFPRKYWKLKEPVMRSFFYSYPDDRKDPDIMSISMPVRNELNGFVDGVAGVDLRLEAVYDQLRFHIEDNQTIFIVDKYGSVLFHRLAVYRRSQGFIPISALEPAFNHYLRKTGRQSCSEFLAGILESKQSEQFEVTFDQKVYHYSCNQLASSPFLVCALLIGDMHTFDIASDSAILSNRAVLVPPVVYHNVIHDQHNICKYFNTISLSDVSKIGLFVSKRALLLYTTRLDILMRDQDRFEQFFKNLHDLKLASFPSFEPLFANNSKISLYYLRSIALKWGADKSMINASFIRRYAATSDGFMIIQPAVKLGLDMDVNQLNWYRKAVENGNRKQFSTPWLDSSETGYVVSISWRVPLTNSSFVVVGFDVTVESLYSHFLYNTQKLANPECQPEVGKDCFLFNEEGNLVAHSQMWNSSFESNSKSGLPGWRWRDINIFSVAYRESDFFSFVSQHKQFFSKQQCYDYNNMHFRFSQKFNLDFSQSATFDKLSSANNGTPFQVRRLDGTNLFLGIRGLVDEALSKSLRYCFCAKNHNERCYSGKPYLNPCWCPCIYVGDDNRDCSNEELHAVESWNACTAEPKLMQLEPVKESYKLREARSCIGFRCSAVSEQSTCDQNRECRWCEFEEVFFRANNTRSIFALNSNHCEQLNQCYMRVKGFSPYEHRYLSIGNAPLTRLSGGSSTTTPIGPVAGGVLASSIVIALAVFLIRHERQRRQMIALYNANYTSDVNVQMTTPHEVDDYSLEQDEDDIGYMNPMLHPLPIIAIRSERRHNHHLRSYATDSDHGYSTMSPHEDSEPNPGAYSDATSVDRSVMDHNSPTDEESERSSTCTGVSSSTTAKAAKKRIQQQKHSCAIAAAARHKTAAATLASSSSSPLKTQSVDDSGVAATSEMGSGSEVEAEVHAIPSATVALAYC